jgi:hypothetical protein
MNALHYSIATAAMAGLLTGGVMKLGPNALADRPIGPQILVSGASKRVIDANGWYADVQFAGYNGEVPDYVLGTDWTQPQVYDVAFEDEAYSYTPADELAPAQIEKAVLVEDTPRTEEPAQTMEVSYPSVDGDILGGLHDEPSAPQVVQIAADSDTLPS